MKNYLTISKHFQFSFFIDVIDILRKRSLTLCSLIYNETLIMVMNAWCWIRINCRYYCNYIIYCITIFIFHITNKSNEISKHRPSHLYIRQNNVGKILIEWYKIRTDVNFQIEVSKKRTTCFSVRRRLKLLSLVHMRQIFLLSNVISHTSDHLSEISS